MSTASREEPLLGLAYRAAEIGALVWTIAIDRLDVDDSAERLFGLRRGTFGTTFRDLLRHVREESRDGVAAAFEQLLNGGMLLEVDMVVDLPDGSARHLQLRGTVLHDAAGQPEHVVAAFRDVTPKAALQTELLDAKRELAARDERLRELSSSIAATARINANLLARTSHEIRTRLDAILGMSRLVLDGPLTPEQRELVSTVLAQGEGMLAIVDDAIDMSAGAADLEGGPIDLRALAAAFASVEPPVEVTVEDTVPAVVHADGARLRRILQNLLAATHGGPAHIHVAATPRGGALHELAIAVHGIDAPASRIPHLFDGSAADHALGLAISAKLVELLGGTVEAAASTDDRLVIRLRLPVEEATEPTDASSAIVDPSLGERHPLRVLVAEDNLLNRKVAGAFLAKLGYAARFACDGREALDLIERERFDVVLMDVDMPVMDGLAAVRELRRRMPREQAPRLVAVTANALPRDRVACLDAGYDDYLAKPLRIEQLAAQLRAVRRLPEIRIDPASVDVAVLGNLDDTLGQAVVAELVATYDADARELLGALQIAAQRGDAVALARAAHTLKSISAALGAVSLRAICAELEANGREGVVRGADALVQRASHELAHVRVALTEHVSRPRG